MDPRATAPLISFPSRFRLQAAMSAALAGALLILCDVPEATAQGFRGLSIGSRASVLPPGRITAVRPNTNVLSSTTTGRAAAGSNAAMGSSALTNATMGGPVVKRTTTTTITKRTTTFTAKTKTDTGKGSATKRLTATVNGNTGTGNRNTGQGDTGRRPTTTTAVTARTNPGTGDPTGNPTGNPTTGNPITGNPTTGNPTTGNPTTGNPATGNPTTGNPTTGNPTTGNPTTGNPTTGNPTTGNPTTGNPNTGTGNPGLANTGNPGNPAIPGGVASAGGGVPPVNFGSGDQTPSGPSGQSGRRSGTGVPPAGERRYVPNEIVVELSSNIPAQRIDALVRRQRLVRLESVNLALTGTTFHRWQIADRRSVPAVVRALEADGLVMAVQPNYWARLQEDTSTTAGTELEQYALAKLRVPQAHGLATGGRIRIAVIDAGVDAGHPEFAGMVVETFDAIGTGDRIHPHGTAVVGAIAAQARLRGTAPDAHILAVRAFGTSRTSSDGTTFNILKGLDWAVARGARIVNMSFAGPRDPAVQRHLARARAKGVVLIAAAGNAGPSSPALYPAADPIVIAVTATDENDKLFKAANRGRHITVAAPGVDLLLPAPDGEFRVTSGTSFAAALVSGAVALLLERNPNLDPDAVRAALIGTARDLGPPGADPLYGAGLVDAYGAILSVAPVATAPEAPVPAAALSQ